MFGVCLTYVKEYEDHLVDCWDMVFLQNKPDKVYVIDLPEDHFWLNHKFIRSLGDNFIRISSYDEIKEHKVLLSPKSSLHMPGDINLKDYTHPENCTYIFGSDIGHINEDIKGDYVFIESKSDIQYFSWIAGAITLYDRLSKYGS